MLAIAEKIVEQQAGEFDPAEFVDRYEDALRAMIEEKKKGQPVQAGGAANDDGKVIDLMAALQEEPGSGWRYATGPPQQAGGGRPRRNRPAGGLPDEHPVPLPASWAFRESKAEPRSRLTTLHADAVDAKAKIRDVLDALAQKHGISARTVTRAMDYADDMLADTVYEAEKRSLEQEIEGEDPV